MNSWSFFLPWARSLNSSMKYWKEVKRLRKSHNKQTIIKGQISVLHFDAAKFISYDSTLSFWLTRCISDCSVDLESLYRCVKDIFAVRIVLSVWRRSLNHVALTNIFSTSNSWSINSARRLATATDARKPSASTPPPVVCGDPTINRIVDDISGLTLLQAADLVSLLKVRNI